MYNEATFQCRNTQIINVVFQPAATACGNFNPTSTTVSRTISTASSTCTSCAGHQVNLNLKITNSTRNYFFLLRPEDCFCDAKMDGRMMLKVAILAAGAVQYVPNLCCLQLPSVVKFSRDI
jgi:hypothetical protein